MSDTVLFLSRPATEGVALIHAPTHGQQAQPVWRLLLAAFFAAVAALTCAAVVILGAPGTGGEVIDAGSAKGDGVRMMIAPTGH